MIGHSSSHFMVKPPLLSCLINEGALSRVRVRLQASRASSCKLR
jgi:hypothetical protein